MRERLARALSVLAGMLAYLGLAVAGWGGFDACFSHPPLVALALVLAVVSSVAFFAGGNLSRGETEDRSNRWVLIVFVGVGLLLGLSAGVYRSRRILDARWRHAPLDRRRTLRPRDTAADLARLCFGQPLQRPGRHSTRTYAGHDGTFSFRAESELFGAHHRVSRLGPGVSLGRRRPTDGGNASGARRANALGGAAARCALRGQVRGLPRADVATPAVDLLRQLRHLTAHHPATHSPAAHSAVPIPIRRHNRSSTATDSRDGFLRA
jgi:hypothetical protein